MILFEVQQRHLLGLLLKSCIYWSFPLLFIDLEKTRLNALKVSCETSFKTFIHLKQFQHPKR